MTQTSRPNVDIPQSFRESLDGFCQRLDELLGDNLTSVVVYGDVTRPDVFSPRSSSINILIVLDQVTMESLDHIAASIPKAMNGLPLGTLILTPQDLRTSTDVFPIKFLNMRERYVVLRGEDVLVDLEIAKDHIRLRCEQEMKNLMLRLRQFYVRHSGFPESIESVLFRNISPFLRNIRVLIELKAGSVGEAEEEIVAAAVDLGLDRRVLEDILALKRGESRLDSSELKALYDKYMRLVQQAAEIVDAL